MGSLHVFLFIIDLGRGLDLIKKVKKLAKKLEASNFPATEKNYCPFLRITQTNKICTYVLILVCEIEFTNF